MNKRGDKILTVYWFLILFLVTGGIIYMVYLFYGAPYDVRMIESTALGDQIANCITSQGYLNDSVFNSNFEKNLTSFCHLNFSVEDVYGWGNQTQYYVELGIYNYDPNSFDLLGTPVVKVYAGNVNLKTAWQLNALSVTSQPSQNFFSKVFSSISSFFTGKRNVDKIVIHSTEGSTVSGASGTIAERGLSIHYMIDRDGNVFSSVNPPSNFPDAFVPENVQGAHAGCGVGASQYPYCSSNPATADCKDSNGLLDPKCQQLSGNLPSNEWCCLPGFNVGSIGIELVNRGDITSLCNENAYKDSSMCKDAVSAYGRKWENFSQAQINSLVILVANITSRYNIPLDRSHIIGHYQITTYKTDPGPAFPWGEFMNSLRGMQVASSGTVSQNLPQGRLRSFYAISKNGNKYIVTVLALVRKTEKNVS